MATTTLAEVYAPDTFNRATQERRVELNAFKMSGVVRPDPMITAKLAGGSKLIEIPQYASLAQGEPNYSNDNSGATSTPKNIGSQLQLVRGSHRNESWSAMTLARELTDADPMAAITASVGKYWANDDEKRVIAACEGVLADNVANGGSDMVIDIATDNVAAIADAERISGEAVVNAEQTLGDHKRNIVAMGVHSMHHATLAKKQLLEHHFDATTGTLLYTTFLGKRLIVDDSLPVEVGTNRMTYTAILFGEGAIGEGEGPVLVPSAIDRIENSGNGGGEDVLYSRVANALHPYGVSFTGTPADAISPTYAELKAATSWTRIMDRKNIALAFLKTNG